MSCVLSSGRFYIKIQFSIQSSDRAYRLTNTTTTATPTAAAAIATTTTTTTTTKLSTQMGFCFDVGFVVAFEATRAVDWLSHTQLS